jgi:hypothetical protein
VIGQKAQSTFAPQNIQHVTTQLTIPPTQVDRKGLAKMTSNLKATQKEYIKNAQDNNDKKAREAQVKLDRKTAANIAKAMKNAAGKKGTPKNLDKLEQACIDGVTVYSNIFKASVDESQKAIRRAKTRLQNAESLEVDTGEKFDREELEQGIRDAESALKDLVRNPEADRLASTIDALFETQLRKNEQLAADLKTAIKAAETTPTEANMTRVKDLANQYRNIFADHATAYGKMPGRDRPQAIVQQEKMIDDMILGAEAKLYELKQAKLGPPPWDPTKQSEANDVMDEGRAFQAKDLLKNGTVFKPDGGSSEVLVLKNGQGKTQFAFKTTQGESSQMGMKKGSGAIREAVSSKIAENVLQQTGLDFGFPKVSIATLEGKVGCLIEGINGTEVPPPDKDPDKAKSAKFQNSVPGKELQKTICAGLAMGNLFDLKWDNVFWEGEGDQAKARPFDAGAAFLPTSEIEYVLHGRVGQQPGFDIPLLRDNQGNVVKGATEPMDSEIIEAMLKIDVKAIEKVIDEETQRHTSTGLDKCLSTESKKNGLKCLTTLQGILLAHKDDQPAPSLETVMAEVQQEIVKAFPKT